jgi:hypothetical protein
VICEIVAMILVVKVGNFSVLAYNLKCHFKDVPVENIHVGFAFCICFSNWKALCLC